MALALTAYEASLCPGCGLPPSLAHGDHNEGRYAIAESFCHGCVPLDTMREDKNRTQMPGQKYYLAPNPNFVPRPPPTPTLF